MDRRVIFTALLIFTGLLISNLSHLQQINRFQNKPFLATNSQINQSTLESSILKTTSTSTCNYSILNSHSNSNYNNLEHLIVNENIGIISETRKLIFLNFTDIQNVKCINELEFSEEIEIKKIIIENHRLYVGLKFDNYYISIAIYELNDLTQIERIGYYTHYNIFDFVVESDIIYILSSNTISAINTTNPSEITLLSSYPTDKLYGESIQVKNKILYISDRGHFQLVSYTDPLYPQLITEYDFMLPDAFYVNDQYLVLVNETELMIVEISNPSNPELKTKINCYFDYIYGIEIYKSHLYLNCRCPFPTLKVYSFENINLVHIVNTSTTSFPNYFKGFTIDDDSLYLFDRYDVINVYNLTNLPNLEPIKTLTADSYKAFSLSNNILYLANNNFEIDILNTTLPNSIDKISQYSSNASIFDIELLNSTAIIGTQIGLEIVDFGNIINPYLLETIDIGLTNNIQVKDNYVFAVGANFTILNFTDLANIEIINTIEIPHTPNNIAVNDEIAIITFGYYGFEIYNITDLTNINFLSARDYYSQCLDVILVDNLAFFAYGYSGWMVFDITDATFPVIKLQIDNYEYAKSITVANDLMYLSSDIDLMLVFNISEIENYTLYGQLNTILKFDFGYDDLLVTEDFVFGLSNKLGIHIINFDSDDDFLANYLETGIYLTDQLNKDTDNDQIIDGYEVMFELNPLNASDASDDFDFDGLTNLNEFLAGTNPQREDSDLDYLLDGEEEIIYYTNPLTFDTDNDRLMDSFEIKIVQTNPTLSDTDSDQLNDYEEIFRFATNPNNNDSDFDEMNDYFEVIYGLNPLDSEDKYLDLDLDGLSNYEEYLLNTKPNLSDTDGDGFSDKEEVDAGTNPLDANDFPDESSSNIDTPSGLYFLFIIPASSFIILVIIYIVKKSKEVEV